jgi:hypothetical protein
MMNRSWLDYGMIACLVSVASSTSTGGDVAAKQQYSQGAPDEGKNLRLGRTLPSWQDDGWEDDGLDNDGEYWDPDSGATQPPTAVDDMMEESVDTDIVRATIVDIAVGNDDFSTLVAALTAAGLVDAIAGEGPFTVFGTCC